MIFLTVFFITLIAIIPANELQVWVNIPKKVIYFFSVKHKGGDSDNRSLQIFLTQTVEALRMGQSVEQAFANSLKTEAIELTLSKKSLSEAITKYQRKRKQAQLQKYQTDLVATSCTLAQNVSGNLGISTAEILKQLIVAIKSYSQRIDSLQICIASTKSTIKLLQFLPLIGIILGLFLGVNNLMILFDGGIGTLSLFLGLVFLGLGHMWTKKLVLGVEEKIK